MNGDPTIHIDPVLAVTTLEIPGGGEKEFGYWIVHQCLKYTERRVELTQHI